MLALYIVLVLVLQHASGYLVPEPYREGTRHNFGVAITAALLLAAIFL